MPIANTPLTRAQFEYLQQNITDQIEQVTEAGAIAQSGLHYVVLLQVDAPEVDLVNPFFDQLERMEGLHNTANWVPVVAALNTHAVNRGSAAVGTLSDRLNQYLSDNAILVTQEYASLSQEAGFTIDVCNIEPGTNAACPAIIDSDLTASGDTVTPFSYTITAKGATPITFNATSLPPGLTFSVDTISGTPTTPGSYAVALSAYNAVNALDPDTKTLVITIS